MIFFVFYLSLLFTIEILCLQPAILHLFFPFPVYFSSIDFWPYHPFSIFLSNLLLKTSIIFETKSLETALLILKSIKPLE
jgi:hypothetical protein